MSGKLPYRRLLLLASTATLLVLFSLSFTPADEVLVKGTVLRGRVAEVTKFGIVFQTEYGEGRVTIPYENIQTLSTDGPLTILHGDSGETSGRLLGVEGGYLLVGEDRATAARIDVRTIVDSDTPDDIAFFGERIRNRFRFWNANLDLGLAFKDATTDETDLNLAAQVERRRRPTRFFTKVDYLLSLERAKGESSRKTDNELRGLVKGEYDVPGRFFLYTSNDFEYDEIDRISLRWIGKAGPGYRIFDNKSVRWQLETGGFYDYERFFGGDTNEFGGIPFGTEGRIRLANGSIIEFSGDYLPSMKDWTGDYLLRAGASLSVPIHRYLALKASIVETYDQTPDENSERNEVKTIVSLSWRF